MRRTCLLVFALACTNNTWGKTVAPCATLDEQQQCVPACSDVEACPEGTSCRMISDGTQAVAICCSGAGCPPFVPFSNPCDDAGPSCVVAAIHVSASTNSAPVDVVLHADGSAERTIEPGSQNNPTTPKNFLAGDANVERFLSDLEASGDVGLYAVVPHCSKSVSFGTSTTITAGDEASGDVQCMSPDAPAAQLALADDCATLAFE